MRKLRTLIAFISLLTAALEGSALAQEAALQPAKIVSFDKAPQFSYKAWEGKVKLEGGKAVLKGLGGDGGTGGALNLDLSARTELSPALKLRARPGNEAARLSLQLLDANGATAAWDFQLPPPSESFSFVFPKACAPLSKPQRLSDGERKREDFSFEFAKTVQWQLQGDWQPKLVDVELEGVWIVPPDAETLKKREAAAKSLVDLEESAAKPFLGWEGKLELKNGTLVLRQAGTNGGWGASESMDLQEKAKTIPALKIRVGAANTAKRLLLQLWDEDGASAFWEFHTPKPSSSFAILSADGASLEKPAFEQDKVKGTPLPPGSLDLSRIKGWQLQGDWQPGLLDLEIAGTPLLPPDPAEPSKKLSDKEAKAETAKQREEAKRRKAAAEREELERRYSARTEKSPEATKLCLVAPDVLVLTVEAQKVVLSKLERYEPKPGDEKRLESWPDGVVRRARLVRDGQEAGWLQGPKLDWLSADEKLEGDPFLYFLAEEPANYALSSSDDPAYATPVHPVAVYRKSAPSDWQMEENAFPMRHKFYLKLPRKLKAGSGYKLSLARMNVKNPDLSLVYDSRELWSEAIHASQIGYRPDDPGKRAFLSTWLAQGGALAYPAGTRFSVIDEASGKDVFSGVVELALAADGKTECEWNKTPVNNSGTAVYRMDFGAVRTPGRYRVHVEGIGCGYPFEISEGVWEKAFKIQMRGLFHNRGGIELGEPWTSFKKPRDFHPADGFRVTRSSCDALVHGNEAFDEIVKGDTGEAVPDAWGGYHDAGDWNPRRASHLAVTMAQLELVELFPARFNAMKLRIPPLAGIPDVITEALFEIDCFRRLQLPDGGVPYGIETCGDPSPREVSWLSTMRAYVLAPNIRDSWQYAAAAGRAAKVLKPFDAALAAAYEASARKAFAWAEADYAKRRADGSLKELQELWRAVDNRNLAALVLYDLSGERPFHDVFLEDTQLNSPDPELYWYEKSIQDDAAFLYARMSPEKTDKELRKRAVAGVEKLARRSLDYAAGNPFNVTHVDKWRPRFCGYYSESGGTSLARAHFLTGKREYLEGAVRSCQFQAGCNPNNLVYTTGLGANPIKHPLHMDSRFSGQPAPEGLSSFGNVDYWNWKGGFWDWPIPFISKKDGCHPNPYEWPLEEAYFDIFLFVSMNEFVVDNWAPNVFVWGYLAARPAEPRP